MTTPLSNPVWCETCRHMHPVGSEHVWGLSDLGKQEILDEINRQHAKELDAFFTDKDGELERSRHAVEGQPMTVIHITVALEARIKREIADTAALPLYGAMNETQYQQQAGRLKALIWVLQLAHAELDE